MGSSIFLLKSIGFNETNISNLISVTGDKLLNLATLIREAQSKSEILLDTSSNLVRGINNPITSAISEVSKETGAMITGAIAEACKGLGVSLMEAIVKGAYPICLFGGVLGLIFYMFGYEKAKPIPILAIGAFLLIKALGGIICGI